ncbi:extensin [Streptomyces sp. NPDC056149]|uniref:extensin n=1 Tax=Streptomyces sp. NPDC056149 TaxID=3345728 RepID=UPI0035D8FDCD
MKQIAAREAVQLLRTMTRVLYVVGVLALVFTTVNVTRFATSRDDPLPIAVLLDPMIGTALAGVLYVDARLAAWGLTPPAWSTTLRWTAGSTAALINTWQSLWPDGQIGWPHHADPAAVLLHLTPALLLIALTETIAAYRRTITDLLDHISSPAPTTATSSGSASPDPDSSRPTINPDHSPPGPPVTNTPSATNGPRRGPDTANDTPHDQRPVPVCQPAGAAAADTDIWPHAVALDDAVRATTGKPASIWRLRTELHLGPKRASQLHNQLQTRPTDRPPTAR